MPHRSIRYQFPPNSILASCCLSVSLSLIHLCSACTSFLSWVPSADSLNASLYIFNFHLQQHHIKIARPIIFSPLDRRRSIVAVVLNPTTDVIWTLAFSVRKSNQLTCHIVWEALSSFTRRAFFFFVNG